MALEVTNVPKEIRFKPKDGKKEITLEYPAGMRPSEAAAFYSKQYPELTTATVEGPTMKSGVAVYSFKTSVGTKG